MNCMICNESIPEDTVMCPNCGAMPWQMPEVFLNEEQHKAWLDAVYKSQLDRWEKQKALQLEYKCFKNNINKLDNKLDELNMNITELKELIKKSVQKSEYSANTDELQTLSDNKITSEINNKPNKYKLQKEKKSSDLSDFEIKKGVLIRYKGKSDNVYIPDCVITIGGNAFYGFENLQSVDIPSSVTSIGTYAFCGCKNLQSVDIPDSMTSIGNSAFSWCKSLQSIDIPYSVVCIDNEAFWGCENLKTVYIPDSVTSIGSYAFRNCVNLKKASVPSHLNVSSGCFPPGCKIICR